MVFRSGGMRPATAGDLGEIVALLEQARLPLVGLGMTTLWVAAGDDGVEVAGVVGLERHGDIGVMRALVVAPAYRGRGVGKTLVDHAVTEAKRDQMTILYALTMNAADYLVARGFALVDRNHMPPELASLSPMVAATPKVAKVLAHGLSR